MLEVACKPEDFQSRLVRTIAVEVVEPEPCLAGGFGEFGQVRVDSFPRGIERRQARRTPFREARVELCQSFVIDVLRKEEVGARHVVEKKEVGNGRRAPEEGGFGRLGVRAFDSFNDTRGSEKIEQHAYGIGGEFRFGLKSFFRETLGRVRKGGQKSRGKCRSARLEDKGRKGDLLRFEEVLKNAGSVFPDGTAGAGHGCVLKMGI